MTKLEEIKAKVDAVIDSYLNEEGSIVDENGKVVSVLFAMQCGNTIAQTVNTTYGGLNNIICFCLDNKKENVNPISDIAFAETIMSSCMDMQNRALTTIVEKGLK